MGKQSAKIYYQGKYHSDIICETDSRSGIDRITTDNRLTKFINSSQVYIGNKLVWERLPADLIFYKDLICVSNDLVHFSSMQKYIDDSKADKYFNVIGFCTFSNKFVCLGQLHLFGDIVDSTTALLYSDDGFKWKNFYETDLQFKLGYTNQIFAKSKCNGKDCLAICIQNEIAYFDSDFELVKTIKSNLDPKVIPVTFMGGETLYLYGKETVQGYGTMEEYVNGELTIRHDFTYYKQFNSDNFLYIRSEDAVYSVSTHGKSLSGKMYKHGQLETLEPMQVGTDDVTHWFPYMSEETIIIYALDDDYSVKYYELKNGSFHFKFNAGKDFYIRAKRDGITSYSVYDSDSLEEYAVFTKNDFFSLDFKNQEPLEIKGVGTFNPKSISQFAYLERKEET